MFVSERLSQEVYVIHVVGSAVSQVHDLNFEAIKFCDKRTRRHQNL